MVNQYDNIAVRDAAGNISGYQNVATGVVTGGATSPLYNQLVAQAAAQQYLTVGSGGTYPQTIPYTQTINPAAYGNTALGIAQQVGAGGGVVDPTFKPLLQQQYGVSLPNSMLPVDSQGNVVSGMNNTVPTRDLSSGMGNYGVPVPGSTTFYPQGAGKVGVPGQAYLDTISGKVTTELSMAGIGGRNMNSPLTNLMGGGGDYSAQSGAISIDRPNSKLVYNTDFAMYPVGDTRRYSPLSTGNFLDVEKNPQNYSQGGEAYYGMFGTPLDNTHRLNTPQTITPTYGSAAWYTQEIAARANPDSTMSFGAFGNQIGIGMYPKGSGILANYMNTGSENYKKGDAYFDVNGLSLQNVNLIERGYTDTRVAGADRRTGAGGYEVSTEPQFTLQRVISGGTLGENGLITGTPTQENPQGYWDASLKMLPNPKYVKPVEATAATPAAVSSGLTYGTFGEGGFTPYSAKNPVSTKSVSITPEVISSKATPTTKERSTLSKLATSASIAPEYSPALLLQSAIDNKTNIFGLALAGGTSVMGKVFGATSGIVSGLGAIAAGGFSATPQSPFSSAPLSTTLSSGNQTPTTKTWTSGSNQTITDARSWLDTTSPKLDAMDKEITALQSGNTTGNQWTGTREGFDLTTSKITAYNILNADFRNKTATYNQMDAQNPSVTHTTVTTPGGVTPTSPSTAQANSFEIPVVTKAQEVWKSIMGSGGGAPATKSDAFFGEGDFFGSSARSIRSAIPTNPVFDIAAEGIVRVEQLSPLAWKGAGGIPEAISNIAAGNALDYNADKSLSGAVAHTQAHEMGFLSPERTILGNAQTNELYGSERGGYGWAPTTVSNPINPGVIVNTDFHSHPEMVPGQNQFLGYAPVASAPDIATRVTGSEMSGIITKGGVLTYGALPEGANKETIESYKASSPQGMFGMGVQGQTDFFKSMGVAATITPTYKGTGGVTAAPIQTPMASATPTTPGGWESSNFISKIPAVVGTIGGSAGFGYGTAEAGFGLGTELGLLTTLGEIAVAAPVVTGIVIGGIGVGILEYSGRLGLTGETKEYSVRTAGEQFAAWQRGEVGTPTGSFGGSTGLPVTPSNGIMGTSTPLEKSTTTPTQSSLTFTPMQSPFKANGYGNVPSDSPYKNPWDNPNEKPVGLPTNLPSDNPIKNPYDEQGFPARNPIGYPNRNPNDYPSNYPTGFPTGFPTELPKNNPNQNPTKNPVGFPTEFPTRNPVEYPTKNPNENPNEHPNKNPIGYPYDFPTKNPNEYPNKNPNEYTIDYPNKNPNVNQYPDASTYDYSISNPPPPIIPKIDIPNLILPPINLGGGSSGGGGAAASKPGRGSSFSARYNYGQGIGDMFGSMRPLNFGKSAPAPRKKSRRK